MRSELVLWSTSMSKAADDCLRKRWLAYEAPNSRGDHVRGLERKAMALPLATGIYVHQGMADLFSGIALDTAVVNAVAAYRAEVSARGVETENNEQAMFTVDEQSALIEALLRTWARASHDRFLEEYEVISVEAEDTYDNAPGQRFMTRSDLVARRRQDRRMFVVNFKTVAEAGEWWLRNWEYDVQTMSEAIPIEQRLGERVAGTLIVGLVKGKRWQDSESKDAEGKAQRYRQMSPLLYGYKTTANPPVSQAQYGWEYTRSKGWYRFNVWEEQAFGNQPVKHWVDNVLPLEALESKVVHVPAILRNETLVEDWLEQQGAREARIRAGRDTYDGCDNDLDRRDVLNSYFPQAFEACNRFSGCPFRDLCFTESVREDPEGSLLYQPRTPHHSTEIEATGE